MALSTVREQACLVVINTHPSIDLGPSARRPLVVVSKIIQKLANNFDSFEEEYMMPFNDLLSQYREPLGQFFVDVGVRLDCAAIACTIEVKSIH